MKGERGSEMRLERSTGKREGKLPQSQVKDLNPNTKDGRKPMKDVEQVSDLYFERLLCGSCYVESRLRGQKSDIPGDWF